MGASLALAGVTACTRQPPEKIVPYVRQPEEIVPGRPLFFATAMTLGGVATGLLVESHEGRPTKIEGNPQHPGSLGATDIFAQAAVLGLYDPDRVADAVEPRRDSSLAALSRRDPRGAHGPAAGAGTRASAADGNQSARPRSRRRSAICWRATRRPGGINGIPPAATTPARAHGSHSANTSTRSTASTAPTSSSRSTPIFSARGPGSLRYARDFVARRRPEDAARMNRLYALESDADLDRFPGGPPPADAAGRHRRGRAADCGGRRRGRRRFGSRSRPAAGRTDTALDRGGREGSSRRIAERAS